MDEKNAKKNLLVLLDQNSTSFCYYENPLYFSPKSNLISIESLDKIIFYARKNNYSIVFIYGNNRLPLEFDYLIESCEHNKIMPLKLKNYKDGVFVINKDDYRLIPKLKKGLNDILILRLPKKMVNQLTDIFKSLLGKFKRLNLVLLDIDSYTNNDLEEYARQLNQIEEIMEKVYLKEQNIEINFLSDRLLLVNMNNCDAGLRHLTYAQNGKFYICPAFYYEDKVRNSIGDLDSEIEIKNSHLLKLDYAPICRNCDAYHCKRCIYLNKKITLEINTPSSQQCVISHEERNITRKLLENLKASVELFQKLHPIPEISYLDPFELINSMSKENNFEKKERIIAELLSKPLEVFTTKELLWQIFKVDRNIIKLLKDINKGVN
jgi:CXXX repeat peptide maturase